jgi:hypothetical protein
MLEKSTLRIPMSSDTFFAHIVKSQMHPLVAGYMVARLDHNHHNGALQWNRLSAYLHKTANNAPNVDVKNLIDSILYSDDRGQVTYQGHVRAFYLAHLSNTFYRGWLNPVDVPRLDRYKVRCNPDIEQDENFAIIAYARVVEIVQSIELEFLSADKAVYYNPDYTSTAVERTYHALGAHAPGYTTTLLANLVKHCSFTVQPALAPDYTAFAEATVAATDEHAEADPEGQLVEPPAWGRHAGVPQLRPPDQ